MHATVIRLLGATAPSAPKTDDGTMVGNAADALAAPVVFVSDLRQSRRLGIA